MFDTVRRGCDATLPHGNIATAAVSISALQARFGLTLGVTGTVRFRSVLYEISPAGPLTSGTVALPLATTVAARLVPAGRAMVIDPVTALCTD